LNRKIAELTLLASIFIIGLFLRFTNFPDSLYFIGDIARDLIAGNLIANHNMNTGIGHWNSGLNIYYPPYYFYFLAFLFKIFSGSIPAVLTCLTIISNSGIIIVFAILKKISTSTTALMGAFLYAISLELIYIGRSHLTVHLSIVIFLLAVYVLTVWIKTKKHSYLILNSLLLTLGSSVYFGIIIFIPITAMLIFYINNNSQKQEKFITIRYSIYSLISYTLFQLPILFSLNTIEIFYKIARLELTTIFSNHYTFSNSYFAILEFFKRSFPFVNVFSIILWIALTLFLCIKNTTYLKISFLFVLTLSIHIVTYVKSGLSMFHYLALMQPLVILYISLSLEYLQKFNKILVFATFIVLSLSINGFTFQPQMNVYNSYAHFSSAAKKLFNFTEIPFYYGNECASKDYFSWESRVFWFFDANYDNYLIESNISQVGMSIETPYYVCYTDINEEILKDDSIIINNDLYFFVNTISQDEILYHIYKKQIK
jgi:hypothetical protein